MRSFISFIVLFILVMGNVSGQKFHGGLTAGIVGSQVAGDGYSGFHKGGIFGGGYVNWEFTEHSGLQLELTYFQKGSRENPKEENDYKYLLFRVNYIELPVLYLFKLPSLNLKNVGDFYLETGPSLGVLTSYFEENQVEVESDKEWYNKPTTFTFQWNIGMRYFIAPKFGVDFRYNFSLLNIRSKNVTGDVWRFWGYGQFNDALVLSLLYQFK
ncbi:MAG: hypothetical protein C0591_04295 [Marinilabiliales bacterium]|nr:MAG: hypothetical protein C0591_04295 [Marinilabiliales bacterium]